MGLVAPRRGRRSGTGRGQGRGGAGRLRHKARCAPGLSACRSLLSTLPYRRSPGSVFPATHAMAALTQNPQFKKLKTWYEQHGSDLNLRRLFEGDRDRFNRFRCVRGTGTGARRCCTGRRLAGPCGAAPGPGGRGGGPRLSRRERGGSAVDPGLGPGRTSSLTPP